jgi:hypothetical protein
VARRLLGIPCGFRGFRFPYFSATRDTGGPVRLFLTSRIPYKSNLPDRLGHVEHSFTEAQNRASGSARASDHSGRDVPSQILARGGLRLSFEALGARCSDQVVLRDRVLPVCDGERWEAVSSRILITKRAH